VRKPTKTIRVDVDSHESMRLVARLYEREWRRHVSLADVIRMGIAVLMREHERRVHGPQQ